MNTSENERSSARRGPYPGFTPEQVIATLEASGGIQSAAAAKLGCSRSTITAYVDRHPEIQTRLAEIRESLIDLAEAQLVANIKSGDNTAIIFYLKTQGKNRGYSERRELSGPDGGAIPVRADPPVDYAKLSTDEKRQLLALLEKAEPDDARPGSVGTPAV